MNKFAFIEIYYDVPCRDGAPVMYQGQTGRVIGISGHYVRVEFQDGSETNIHPQSLRWLEDEPLKVGE